VFCRASWIPLDDCRCSLRFLATKGWHAYTQKKVKEFRDRTTEIHALPRADPLNHARTAGVPGSDEPGTPTGHGGTEARHTSGSGQPSHAWIPGRITSGLPSLRVAECATVFEHAQRPVGRGVYPRPFLPINATSGGCETRTYERPCLRKYVTVFLPQSTKWSISQIRSRIPEALA